MPLELHSTILRLAGKAAFEKGTTLFHQNAVISFTLDGNQISAQVQDTYVYDIKLAVLNNGFDGGCTCPASEGFDFCEHCVAVALHYEKEKQTLEALLSGKPAERVKGYLKTLDQDTLAEELYKLLSEDADKFNQWLMFADITIGDFDIKDLRKRIIKAMPLRDVWRHQQVRNYFDKSRKQMNLLLEVIGKLPAENAYQLCLYALARYDKILERIDDSGGFRFGLFHLIEKGVIQAFNAIDESVDSKLTRLLNILDHQFTYIDFGDVGGKFIPTENDELQRLYYKELSERCKKQDERETIAKYQLNAYANSLANYHERKGEISRAIKFAFLAKPTFVTGYSYLTKLIDSNEYSLAEKYLDAVGALAKSKEDIYKSNYAKYSLKHAVGKMNEAKACAWTLFASSLSVNDLQRILDMVDEDSDEEQEIHAKAENMIKASLDNNLPKDAKDYSPLLDFYIAINRLTSAIQLTRRYEFLEDSLHELAYVCLQNEYYLEGIDIYKRLVNHYILKGQTKNYQIAIDLLSELIEFETKSSALGDTTDVKTNINALLNDICFTHASKQQFMKMLNIQLHVVDQ